MSAKWSDGGESRIGVVLVKVGLLSEVVVGWAEGGRSHISGFKVSQLRRSDDFLQVLSQIPSIYC